MAKKIAGTVTVGRFRHGAVVAKGGRVLGVGACCTSKSHPRWGSGPLNSVHAEAAAIRDALSRGTSIAGATIYVARAGKRSHRSRPCPACMRIIREHGIRRIVYTTMDGSTATEKL